MEPQQCFEYSLHIATTRDEIVYTQECLETTTKEVAAAQQSIEDLTLDACVLRVRMKELELDEELVKRSEDDAIMEKIVSQKRLVEIGGVESAVRALQKALADAQNELRTTREETQYAIAEEKKMQTEIMNLSEILRRSRGNSIKLQEEYSAVMREKRESDAKLKQLCLFLQTETPQSPVSVNSDLATASPSSSAAASPRLLQLGGVEVAVPEVQF